MPHRIPCLDLKAQYRDLHDELHAALDRTLDRTEFVLGSEVAAFENEFAAYCEVPYAVAVNSGTSALHLALLAAGVGPGDEVITVPFTFVATVAAIEHAGARPRLADVDPRTFCLDPGCVAGALTPRTRAILPVHLFGQPAPMGPVLEFARRHGLKVIEDAAQAHGARLDGVRAGASGDLACFSFYPGKNLGAYGEGGAIVTRDPEAASRIRMLRDWGQDGKYHHVLKAFNYRMDGIQGAVLRVKLRRLEAWNARRRELASLYDRLLEDVVTTPYRRPGVEHAYHVYAILCDRRDELQRFLAEAGIESRVVYPYPVHLQPAYRDLGYAAGDFPCAESLCGRILALPLYPEMREDDVRRVAERVRAFY